MIKVNDCVRYLGPDVPELGLCKGMEGTVVSINVPNGVYTDDDEGDHAQYAETVATVDFMGMVRFTDGSVFMYHVHEMLNESREYGPYRLDVPPSRGIGVFARQLERLLK